MKSLCETQPLIAVNENAQHREVWFKDLDGYTVVLAALPDDL